MKYNKIALGGTFDHFHAGHQAFLLEAAQYAEQLVIGVTADSLVKNKRFAELIEPLTLRTRAVKEFCHRHSLSCEIITLSDIFGPTLTDQSIEALFVTNDTLRGGEVINLERESKGLISLPIIKAKLLEDKEGKFISSERIRSGEINRQGINFHRLFSSTLVLSEQQRQYFSKAQGELITEPTSTAYRAVVGDSTFEAFLTHRWPYDLAIADLRKQRLEIESPHFDQSFFKQRVKNAAGEITKELAASILFSVQSRTAGSESIFVDGEEDLAAVAALMLLPLNSAIYYGQPGKGMIEMIATEEKKQEIYQVLHT